MHAKLSATIVAIVLITSGCATQTVPRDNPSKVLVPEAWKNVVTNIATPVANWRSFNDSMLADLIDLALRNNPDAATAIESLKASRVAFEQAQAASRIVYSIEGGTSTNKSRDSNTIDAFDTLATVSYELDLWGKNRDTVTLAELDIVSAKAQYLTTRISIAAEVADTYYSIRVADAQLQYKRQTLIYTLKQQGQILARKRAGIATGIEVDRQEVEVQRLRFQIEQLSGIRNSQENRLATLTGQSPQAFTLAAADRLVLPEVYLRPELPVDVLRARPDIRSVEAQLEASRVNIELAQKAFFPTITLTGKTGFASASLNSLIRDTSWSYSVGANLITTLLDNGTRSRNVELARIGAAQQVALYRKSILTALREVEDALNQQQVSLRQLEIQKLSLASQQRVTREARARYQLGSISGFELINEQRALLTQQEAILTTHLTKVQATIQLFRAVGITPDQ